MRCYFLRKGHIAGVEVLPEGLTDTEAVERAQQLFVERQQQQTARYDGFEVWDRARHIHRWPPDS